MLHYIIDIVEDVDRDIIERDFEPEVDFALAFPAFLGIAANARGAIGRNSKAGGAGRLALQALPLILAIRKSITQGAGSAKIATDALQAVCYAR